MIPCVKKISDCVPGDLFCSVGNNGLLKLLCVWQVIKYYSATQTLEYRIYYTQSKIFDSDRIRITSIDPFYTFMVVGNDPVY